MVKKVEEFVFYVRSTTKLRSTTKEIRVRKIEMVGICTLAQQFLVKGPKKEKKTGLKIFFPPI